MLSGSLVANLLLQSDVIVVECRRPRFERGRQNTSSNHRRTDVKVPRTTVTPPHERETVRVTFKSEAKRVERGERQTKAS